MNEKNNDTAITIPIDEGISDKLFELSQENPLLFSHFVKYCYVPHLVKLDKDSLKQLIAKGLIRANYSIPTDVRVSVLRSTALY